MHDRAKDERPLLITTEEETCDKTLKFLHKNVATNITDYDEEVKKDKTLFVDDNMWDDKKGLKDNFKKEPTFTEEEMYNPNLRVVDLPKTSTENMFVLIGGGGNPDDYDANGRWIGGGGFQKDQNGKVKPGQFVIQLPKTIETLQKEAVLTTTVSACSASESTPSCS